MRSDARQNRTRILDSAAALILEVGGEPTREALARRAGVGIGTVYRHFPDRQSLLHAVARHVLENSIAAGERSSEDRAIAHAQLDRFVDGLRSRPPTRDAPTRGGSE